MPGVALLVVIYDVPSDLSDLYNDSLTALSELLAGLTLPADAAEASAAQESGSATDAQATDLETYVDAVAADLDALWREVFAENGDPYESPGLVLFDEPVSTACGDAAPGEVGPFYCTLDRTIYLDVPFLETEAADFGPGAVANSVAHEWGHHVQQLLGIGADSVALSLSGSSSLEAELQADCLGGFWTQTADVRGLFEPGDVEGVLIELAIIGDSADALAASSRAFYDAQHGSGSLRTWWFLQGYYVGLEACFA